MQELTTKEVEQVNGGIAPLLVLGGANVLKAAAGFALSFSAGFAAGRFLVQQNK